MRVLIVDDEINILRVVGDFLTDCGHEVLTAEQGVDALAQLEVAGDVDVILSDVRMPRMDGLDLLRTVRLRHPGIPLILMTGHGDESVATAALQYGAQDYLKKPVGLRELMHCMDRIDERRRLEAQVLADFRQVRRGLVAGEQVPSEAMPTLVADFLVVFPDDATTRLVRDILQRLGHTVHSQPDAASALKLFAEQTIDVVITAVDLPDVDGIDLVAEMRSIDSTVIPLIVSARPDRQTLVRALECGAVGYLNEPLVETELRRLIAKALSEHKRSSDMQKLLGDLIEGRSDLQTKIAERERYLSHLIDSAPFGIVSTDNNGKILTFNGKAEQIHGYTEADIKGRPLSLLFADPADGSGLNPGSKESARRQHLKQNGELVPVLLHSSDVMDGGQRVIARLHVIEDHTDREHVEAQLLQAERLSVLGQLAPRIAHEFKTPLQAILGNADLATSMIESGQADEAREFIGEIVPAVTAMTDLVQQMLNLGKPTASSDLIIDLKTELNKLLSLLSPLRVLRQCDIEVDCPEDVPAIKGDPAQIEQVFRNLVVNASHAMEGVAQRRLYLGVHGDADGRRVIVTIRDTGCGITEENLERMFQPFFTTKPEGKGTGLGLPIVKTILDRHGASVQVDSTVDVGTTFTITFASHQTQG